MGRTTPASRTKTTVPALLRGAAIGVVGTGHIGGSIVKRLSRYRPKLMLFASDRSTMLRGVVQRHARWCGSLDELVRQCDVVVLAVPVPEVIRLMPRIARIARRRSSNRRLVVCDVATVKARCMAAAAPYRGVFDYVGLHPLAGSERSGWAGADPNLFVDRTVVFCPGAPQLNAIARSLIRLLGGRPTAISAERHDAIVALTIGLPHVLAFAAAGLAGRESGPGLGKRGSGPGLAKPGTAAVPLQGGSWRSLTRVSASGPAMVAGFLHGNAANQLRVLRLIQARLRAMEKTLRQGSYGALERQLRRWQAGK